MNYLRLSQFTALILLLACLSVILGYVLWDAVRFYKSPLSVTEPLKLDIDKGDTLAGLLYRLQRQGVIKYPRYALWYASATGKQNIKAGEYEILPTDDLSSFFSILAQGKIVQYPFTIIEGWTIHQVRVALSEQPLLKQDASLPLELEGWLMPDTYFFHRGMSAKVLIDTAHSMMQDYLDIHWPKRSPNLPINTPYEALIVASIIEKETALAEEKPLVAAVIYNRLNKGMRLQMDPTVIYGLGEYFDGNITRKNLRTKSPYNTYTMKGLPPTPIAMPGTESINAALLPAESDILYFVAMADGRHEFSRTLKEHNAAVARYQKLKATSDE